MRRRYKKTKRERCSKTGKVTFLESEARRFVKNSLSSDESKRRESRYYFCSSCEGYHMTKMSKALYVYKTSDEDIKKEEERKIANLFFKKKWISLIKKNKEDESSIS